MHELRSEKMKIMVVDDSRTVQLVARMTLEKSGYEVISLEDAHDLSAHVIREQPDLILLDLEMPVSGTVLLESMREEGLLGSSPVVLHSSAPRDELEEAARWYKADGYIEKTSDSEEFLRQIEEFLAMMLQS